jgi:hypothetical protein
LRININTGLDGFGLVDAVTEVGNNRIEGLKRFADDPAYQGIEALAQLGALHVRFLNHFDRHAFLLKIDRCTGPNRSLNGGLVLSGKLIHHSKRAFSYHLEACFERHAVVEGDFLFAVIDYDETFKKQFLKSHFQKKFLCLQNGLKKD